MPTQLQGLSENHPLRPSSLSVGSLVLASRNTQRGMPAWRSHLLQFRLQQPHFASLVSSSTGVPNSVLVFLASCARDYEEAIRLLLLFPLLLPSVFITLQDPSKASLFAISFFRLSSSFRASSCLFSSLEKKRNQSPSLRISLARAFAFCS